MQKRRLGDRNLAVSALGLDCIRMSFGDSPVGDKQEMISFLHAAADRGITFFDTAKVYRVLIDLLAKIGEQKGATPAQMALAWLLAQKPWIFPIPGNRKLERLDENTGAVAVELTADDLWEIEHALSKITVQEDRYPKEMAKMSGR